MKTIVAILGVSGVLALAQAPASMSGTVTGPNGAPVAGAPVQAKNVKTAAAYRGLSSPQGTYTLSGVPAGTYTITVNVPGFAFTPFVKPDVTIGAGERLLRISVSRRRCRRPCRCLRL